MKRYTFSEEEFRHIAKSTFEFAVYQFVDQRVVTIALTQGFLDVFGYENREEAYFLMDNDMYRDTHPDDVARIADAALRFATEGGEYNVIYRTRRNGEYRVIHAYGKHIYPAEGIRLAEVWYADEGAYIGDDILDDKAILRDFSISLYEESLRRKINYDYLTGLPNMAYFFEIVKAERDRQPASNQHFLIGYVNINGMRYFNKKFGFAEGDKLIRSIGGLLAKHFGNENCCRIGQDDFAFFYTKDNIGELLSTLFMEVDESEGSRNIAIRVGIFDYNGEVVETSVACDRARYASNKGKVVKKSSYTYFDDSMLEYETKRQYILDNIDKAVEEGWIRPYYQPIIRAANGRVSDEEALARWIDPKLGLLSPADFIPILEDSKLIYKVDLHILDCTLKKIEKQKEKNLYIVPTSINLSRTDFDVCDMVEEIRKRVDAAGVDRSLISIEITESVVGSDFDFIKEQICKFQALGFKVWIDDFGSGYSSLDVLQSIHFDTIKLDMRFMKQFNNDEKSRVRITELMKMAIGLGIETIAEGVERPDQLEFLKEVGCTKLQGFYYCKPIPVEEVFARYDRNQQIGFENPDESEYFESIGRINLYDLAAISDEEEGALDRYFNTLPMAVFEANEESLIVSRSNRSYRKFLENSFGTFVNEAQIPYSRFEGGPDASFAKAIRQCCIDGEKHFIDERIGADSTIHAFIRRVSVNPVTGYSAILVVVLAVINDTGRGVTYADVANSLSADYITLYYVNLKTEEFVEYRPNPKNKSLSVERHGVRFFEAGRRDAKRVIHEDERDGFINVFTRENVLSAIEKNGSFTRSYRLKRSDGSFFYASMTIVRMTDDPEHIIVGVKNIDMIVRQRETIERMREEQVAYARISALAGDYLCIYTVDPDTEHYSLYGVDADNIGIDLSKEGDDFFKKALTYGMKYIIREDHPLFLSRFSKEKILNTIKENGVYILNYRLMIKDKPTYVSLRAVLVDEPDGSKIIIGINNIDSQVRKNLI